MDLVFIGALLGLAAVTALLVRLCDRLAEKDRR
jgi:hypothetical protein